MKVYIAGKVSRLPYDEALEKFQKAEDKLTALGLEVVNPMKTVSHKLSWKECMDVLLPIVRECDAIYLLPDWKNSLGALQEYTEAEKYGLIIMRGGKL